MGKRSRRKGGDWERELVRWFKERLGYAADRTAAMLESIGGPTGVDIRAVRGDRRFAIQAKIGAQPNAWKALLEAEAGAQAREIPVAIVKRNRKGARPMQTLVCMSPEAFARLVEGDGG